MRAAQAIQPQTELTVAQVAELRGCSIRYIRKMLDKGLLSAEKRLNERNRPTYYIPLSALDAKLQKRYLKGAGAEVAASKAVHPAALPRPLERYSLVEREQIAFWSRLVEEWRGYRLARNGVSKAGVDEQFVTYATVAYQEEYQQLFGREFELTRQTLYRHWRSFREQDLEGLIEKRGKALKGKSAIPPKLWDAFLYYYLDEAKHAVSQCYQKAQEWAYETCPDLLEYVPSESSFRRKLHREVPAALEVLGREGEKAFNDRFAPYIRRVYDEMESNEYWVADTHTLDVISAGEGGTEHRLYLVAFFDARSGIFTGCHITDQPSSQATLYALRKGIQKFGIPVYVYVDNGREFLTHDVGGLGHRARKKAAETFSPPPVFEQLGITMVNALVRNAKAKVIERRFRDVKEHLSRLFPTYTGGNILERPEQLKYNLAAGKIVADKELTETVELLLFHYFNEQPYGGAVVKDRGKPRMQVYQENLHTRREPRCEEDLNLLMMRCSRPQKVGRRGVNFKTGDIQIDYWTDEFLAAMEGKEVYYRYDPENLSTIRVYSCPGEQYLTTLPADNATVLKQGCGVEELKEAQRKVHSFSRMQKKALEELRGAVENPISALELAKRRARRNQNLEYLPNADLVTEYVGVDEYPLLDQAVGYGLDDLDIMIRTSEERQKMQATGGYDDE